MKIKIGLITYAGTREQFEQIINEIDTAPETKDLPPWKRDQIKRELERQLEKQPE